MAMQQQNEHQQQNPSLTLLDALYCEEEKWEEEEEEQEQSEISYNNDNDKNGESNSSLFPALSVLEQDLFWEDEELLSLFAKEEEQKKKQTQYLEEEEAADLSMKLARRHAVEWILKVNAHYGFTALTAVLAVNFLDRFLSSLHFQRDKPWMIQLVAVTCLSLAAKVEETQVPLLLDLQVKDSKYLFEAKTVQRMELLVLSTLQWKMHPVTPLSFLDLIIRRLGLKTTLHWDFLKRCERLLLSLVSDSRFIGYLPSVLATATMMRVIDHVEPFNAIQYKTQLLSVLKLSKEKVEKCYTLIVALSSGYNDNSIYSCNYKRKINEVVPSSPSGVIDVMFSSDSSNDSWAVGSSSSSTSSSVCSSPKQPLYKKSRSEDQQMRSLPSLSRVFVDIVGSPH